MTTSDVSSGPSPSAVIQLWHADRTDGVRRPRLRGGCDPARATTGADPGACCRRGARARMCCAWTRPEPSRAARCRSPESMCSTTFLAWRRLSRSSLAPSTRIRRRALPDSFPDAGGELVSELPFASKRAFSAMTSTARGSTTTWLLGAPERLFAGHPDSAAKATDYATRGTGFWRSQAPNSPSRQIPTDRRQTFNPWRSRCSARQSARTRRRRSGTSLRGCALHHHLGGQPASSWHWRRTSASISQGFWGESSSSPAVRESSPRSSPLPLWQSFAPW